MSTKLKVTKFNIGDTVYLRPYEDFSDHIAIHQLYWNMMNAKNPHIITDVRSGHSVKGKKEILDDIYYNLGDNISYSEEFLMEHFEILPDELFEV